MGQIQILSNRRPVDEVLRDPETVPALREKLELVESVRKYARERLDMPVEGAYSTYVETGKSHVVWNVFAAPEFSLDMKTFCFPVAGCVNYKGFFHEEDALRAARKLRRDGYDVFVGGVAAYSTLGWFDDPVMDTFLARSDTRLAALLFHELAHKAVYVRGDTSFNEGFATTVERHALRQWLVYLDNTEAYQAYRESEARRRQVIGLVRKTRSELEVLYARDVGEETKRREKREIIERLKQDYQTLKGTWAGHDEFENWMAGTVNNAALGALGTYQDRVPAFEALLAQADYEIPVFIDLCRELAAMDKSERDQRLRLARKGHVNPITSDRPSPRPRRPQS